MDDVLAGKMKALCPDIAQTPQTLDVGIEFRDDDGTIELIYRDRKETYKLRPLDDLYGTGNGSAVSMTDETFLPLLMGIEEEIARFDTNRQRLTDAAVLLAMQHLSMNPSEPSSDPLVRCVQNALRITLSLNEYSRQEVRQAIRKVGKSVERHRDGKRGYLEFIGTFFARAKRR